MAKMKAPKGISGQVSSQRSESSRSWYAPLLALYIGNRRLVTGIGVGVIAVIAAIVGYNYIQGARNIQAQELLGAIILEYESGDHRTALDGTGDILGLIEIVERYGGTPAGNTARFYAGNAHFSLEEYDLALEQFDRFNAKDDFLGASVTAGRAAIHELQGDYRRAADLFVRAAEMDDGSARSPYYLRSAARAYLESGDFDEAEEVVHEVRENYPETDLIDEFDYILGMILARNN